MIIVLMGVAGSGKTTIGGKLALAMGCPFYDGDDYHSPGNREKMARGIPLTDGDRSSWLRTLHGEMKIWERENPLTLLACSALKQKYRDLLSDRTVVRWIYLKGDAGILRQRLGERQGHFAGPDLLESQFQILEEPTDAIVVDVGQEPGRIVKQLVEALKGTG
jgi:gluconokinase